MTPQPDERGDASAPLTTQPIEGALSELEVRVLNLILMRISLRGRIRVQQDLAELETLANRELPEVQEQLDAMFQAHGLPFVLSPARPTTATPSSEASPTPRKKLGPGRPKGSRGESDRDPGSE